MYCPRDYVDQKMSQGLSHGSWHKEVTESQGLVKLSRVLQVCLMKLIERNNTYINTYVLYPTALDDDLFHLWY